LRWGAFLDKFQETATHPGVREFATTPPSAGRRACARAGQRFAAAIAGLRPLAEWVKRTEPLVEADLKALPDAGVDMSLVARAACPAACERFLSAWWRGGQTGRRTGHKAWILGRFFYILILGSYETNRPAKTSGRRAGATCPHRAGAHRGTARGGCRSGRGACQPIGDVGQRAASEDSGQSGGARAGDEHLLQPFDRGPQPAARATSSARLLAISTRTRNGATCNWKRRRMCASRRRLTRGLGRAR
jgi:hypothetical protein